MNRTQSTFGLAASLQEAERLRAEGRVEEALAVSKQVASRHPSSPEAQFVLGLAYQSMRRLTKSVTHLRKAVRMAPQQARFRAALCGALSRAGKPDEAMKEAKKALELDPRDPVAIQFMGSMLRSLGRFEEALDLLENATADPSTPPRLICAHTKALRTLDRYEESARISRELLARDDLADRDRVTALFDLAAALDSLEDYDGAWEAASEANRLHGGVYDPAEATARAEETLRVWTRARLDAMPKSGLDAPTPVFIVGMPRSGTTLIEQIIAAHPKGAGVGERMNIPAAARELLATSIETPSLESVLNAISEGTFRKRAGEILTSMLELAQARGVSRIADKQMANVWHVGLISRLLPGARIVSCTRHPLDTIVSCYFQDFGEPTNLGFVYNLEHLACELRLTRRLIQHWREVEALPIFDASYEGIIEDPEGRTRALIDFLAIEWDDACLSFHKAERAVITLSFDQVRRPIYRSSLDRWRNYERQLAPAIEALGDLLDSP
ncbi:MAG: tetratricopeptide repeat protein [Phycisphaerales bacterium]